MAYNKAGDFDHGNNGITSKDVFVKAEGEDHFLNPGLLEQNDVITKALSWTWDIAITFLPLAFMALAVAAVKLDQTPVADSQYGARVEELTRLGPTIFPILFAMVAARFFKNAARWRLEKAHGISVLSLEQLVGSQSFASALERLVTVRAWLLGGLILSAWAMSPLGGQSSSRILPTGMLRSDFTRDLYYDIRTYQASAYFDTDIYFFRSQGVITALFSGSLISPQKHQRASIDLWGRPKIAQWPHDWTEDIEEATWRDVNVTKLGTGVEHYTSLVGVNMGPLHLDNQATNNVSATKYNVNLESEYIGFNCSLVSDALSLEEYESITFWRHNNKTKSTLKEAVDAKVRPDSEDISFAAMLAYSVRRGTRDFTQPHMIFFSRDSRATFNCSVATIHLETNIICTPQECSPYRQRRLRRDNSALGYSYFQRRLDSIENALYEWPRMTPMVIAKASAIENYIANDDNAYSGQGQRSWTGVDTEMFSRRLTTAFNTAWDAGIDQHNITKSSLLC
ncbi:hypothetical protein Cob_v011248 [Colletotrichum orbiculare MAFF 240422]|uniref:Uncharacterized protein n=1 Tax=Colletotrichum orbiculare (strain 104-T / ATCC 96160 / CBS 514.97 / LARS 414 / MAFF 240422) TaxID=1213857 RepID=A0A484FBZ6_COLOR|nr:hypothetical protein Cob_v011248 [Colletotrichum orbiculare MAFF 240422]